jgi:hypothetical protein
MTEFERRIWRQFNSLISKWRDNSAARRARLRHGATTQAQRATTALGDLRDTEAAKRAANALHDLRESDAGKRAATALGDLRDTEAAKRAASALADLRQRESVRKAEETARRTLHDLRSGHGSSDSAS